MCREDLVDVATQRNPAADEDDEVVADTFQVGDEVRREDDADALHGDDLHQRLQELASRERVKGSDRLVEQQQLGSLGYCHRERQLRALPAGQRAGALAPVEAQLVDPRPCELGVPARVEVSARS